LSSQRWFQRRRIGLGWRPVGWQGRLVTALTACGLIAVFVLLPGSSARLPVAILVLAAYSIVGLATGGWRRPAEAPPAEVPHDEEAAIGQAQQEALRTLTAGWTARSSEGTALARS
jgi:hypothetical protein